MLVLILSFLFWGCTASQQISQQKTKILQPKVKIQEQYVRGEGLARNFEFWVQHDEIGNLVFFGGYRKWQENGLVRVNPMMGFYLKKANLLAMYGKMGPSVGIDRFGVKKMFFGNEYDPNKYPLLVRNPRNYFLENANHYLSEILKNNYDLFDKRLHLFFLNKQITPEVLPVFAKYFQHGNEEKLRHLGVRKHLEAANYDNPKLFAAVTLRIHHSNKVKDFWKILRELDSESWKRSYERIENLEVSMVNNYYRLFWKCGPYPYQVKTGEKKVKIIAKDENDLLKQIKKLFREYQKSSFFKTTRSCFKKDYPFCGMDDKNPEARHRRYCNARLDEIYIDADSKRVFDFRDPAEVYNYIFKVRNYLIETYEKDEFRIDKEKALKAARKLCPAVAGEIYMCIKKGDPYTGNASGIKKVIVYHYCFIGKEESYRTFLSQRRR
ncbi:hypothetical protein [Thermodesulfatator autotrophicus]|uniref:hypothetical protein n=1 Tax=Thermodesulfatator autotrophicus TaxID=1795632 RepID=UPI0012F7DEAF|nr:hypothetical protein [Thermodesulfatator autotrophicus]